MCKVFSDIRLTLPISRHNIGASRWLSNGTRVVVSKPSQDHGRYYVDFDVYSRDGVLVKSKRRVRFFGDPLEDPYSSVFSMAEA